MIRDIIMAAAGNGGAQFLLGVAHDDTPFTSIYYRQSGVFTKIANPAVLPGGNGGLCVHFSQSGVYYFVGQSSDPIQVYKRSGFNFTALAANLGGNNATGIDSTADGVYFAIADGSGPKIRKRSGDDFSTVVSPVAVGNITDVSFSQDGVYLGASGEGNSADRLVNYKRTGDTFTRLASVATIPAGGAQGISLTADGVYEAVAHANTPFVSIYKRSGDTWTKLANPATLPTGNGLSAAFSADGVYLAVGHGVSPFVTIYKRSGDTFTKLANPATLPTSAGTDVEFDKDAGYLAVSHGNSPFVTIYARSGDTFTKVANPATLPAGNGNGVAFYPRAF